MTCLRPIRLREPLTDIQVPLRRYGTTLKHDQPLDPPLDGDDTAWFAGLIENRIPT